jgi:uncharacterized membrane protein
VANIVDAVGDETREMIDRLYPAGELGRPEPVATPQGGPVEVVGSPGPPGVLDSLDIAGLVERAQATGSMVEVVPAIGDFVPEGAPLFRAFGSPLRLDRDGVRGLVHLGRERTMEQDVPFGFRQLVDIAERALSPAVVDPTTAVQVIDQLHDLLRRLATRPFPSGGRRDAAGVLRVVLRSPTWESYVALAVDEIRHYGAGSIQVARRLRAMVEDVLAVAPTDRRPPLEQQIRLLDAMVERSFPDEEDRRDARTPDTHGLG